jgi:hypothetical protein
VPADTDAISDKMRLFSEAVTTMNAQAEAVASRIDVIKVVTVGAPLLATSLAIFYDVGFFYAIDAGFFTFFSVTEHLVFALQALPFALIPALWVLSMAALVYFGDRLILKKQQEILDQASRMSREQLSAMSEAAGKRIRRRKWVPPVFIMISLACSTYLFWTGSYVFALVGMVGCFWIYLFDWPLKSMSSERRVLFGVVSVSVIWAIVYDRIRVRRNGSHAPFRLAGMSCRALRWLPIQLAPEDCDLEVGELDKTGIMPLGFPCRRKLGVWYNAWADEPILICPTHWRIWRAPTSW